MPKKKQIPLLLSSPIVGPNNNFNNLNQSTYTIPTKNGSFTYKGLPVYKSLNDSDALMNASQYKDKSFDPIAYLSNQIILNENNKPSVAFNKNSKQNWYNPFTNNLNIHDSKGVLAELSHSAQAKQKSVIAGIAGDWLQHPYVTPKGQKLQYHIPGTTEHEAHSVIEPQLQQRYMNVYDSLNKRKALGMPLFANGGIGINFNPNMLGRMNQWPVQEPMGIKVDPNILGNGNFGNPAADVQKPYNNEHLTYTNFGLDSMTALASFINNGKNSKEERRKLQENMQTPTWQATDDYRYGLNNNPILFKRGGAHGFQPYIPNNPGYKPSMNGLNQSTYSSDYAPMAFKNQQEQEDFNILKQSLLKKQRSDLSVITKPLAIVSDVASLGNFIPHPIAQGIGKAGNVGSILFNGMQAVNDLQDGNYVGAGVNALASVLPIGLSKLGFVRASANATGLMKKLSKPSYGGYYRPLSAMPHLANNPVIQKGIKYNQLVAGSEVAGLGINSFQNGGHYTVKKGNRLIDISKRMGVPVQDLIKANGIKNPNLIIPGTVIKNPSSKKAIPTNSFMDKIVSVTNTPIKTSTKRTLPQASGSAMLGEGNPLLQQLQKQSGNDPVIMHYAEQMLNNGNKLFITDKGKKRIFYDDNGQIKTTPVLTGKNDNVNAPRYFTIDELEQRAETGKNPLMLKGAAYITPVGATGILKSRESC